MKLLWEPEALAALRAIIERGNGFSAGAGTRLGSDLRDAAKRAADRPLAGRMVPEFGLPDVRERIVGSYRLVYAVLEDRVEIVGIVHGARNLQSEPHTGNG